MDQQPPDVAVAAFADPKERGLAAGRVFSRHQAEPCGQVTRPSELTASRRWRLAAQWRQAARCREWSSAAELVR